MSWTARRRIMAIWRMAFRVVGMKQPKGLGALIGGTNVADAIATDGKAFTQLALRRALLASAALGISSVFCASSANANAVIINNDGDG